MGERGQNLPLESGRIPRPAHQRLPFSKELELWEEKQYLFQGHELQ
jgi:hypothetical protein